ncbi:MAG: SPOR domain-containing protein [Leptothrix sp. (in: b-proteobacteria)]
MATVGAPPADEPETAPAVSPRVAPVGGLTPVDESGRPPAEAAAPELTLLPISTDLPKGHFAVRIGLFSDESNAYRQAATLRDVVWTHQDLLPEERAIRVLKPDSRFIVLLGDLADAQAARQLVSKIRRLLHRESIIYTR